VARFTEASDLLPIDKASKYSGWCPVCRERKEWCGFSHESLGLDQTSAKNNGGGSGKKTSLGWSLSEYEAKVKRKASKRRGQKMATQWKQGQLQRTAAQHWNQRRLCREEEVRDKEMEVTCMEKEVQDVGTASEGGDDRKSCWPIQSFAVVVVDKRYTVQGTVRGLVHWFILNHSE
jgi:hypothetical protein